MYTTVFIWLLLCLNNSYGGFLKHLEEQSETITKMVSPKKEMVKKNGAPEDLEFWMTNLPSKLRSTPVIYLAIPGSHDSFTAAINNNSEISPDAEQVLQDLGPFLGACIKPIMVNWSRTQTFGATDQLCHGIRYFDLRLATKSDENTLRFVHGLYSEKVQSVFDEINSFLDTHPGEIVILDCQHFYAFNQSDHDKLMQMLDSTFGTKLLPYTEHMDYITLEYMTTQFKYQVIVIYRSDAARFGQPLLWPSASFPNPWADTVNETELFAALDNGLKTRSPTVAYISQCILTPTAAFVFRNLFNTLKKTCAEELEKVRLEWIGKQTPGEGGLNVIIVDFIELNDSRYVRKVVELNEKLINNTVESVKFISVVSNKNQIKGGL